MLPIIKDDPVNKTLVNVHFRLYFMTTTFLLYSAPFPQNPEAAEVPPV